MLLHFVQALGSSLRLHVRAAEGATKPLTRKAHRRGKGSRSEGNLLSLRCSPNAQSAPEG